jgi:uncharacterized protein (TIGR03000 family)
VLPPPMKEPPAKEVDSTAKLVINVPEDAKLFIDNVPMKTTSANRTFKTPQLIRGQTYFYDIRVEVVRGGQTVSETKRVLLRAGSTIQTSFNDLIDRNPTEAVAAAEK